MNETELIDKINALQAQTIGLALSLASVVRQSGLDAAALRSEIETRAGIFQAVMATSQPHAQAQDIQRSEFQRILNTVCGPAQ